MHKNIVIIIKLIGIIIVHQCTTSEPQSIPCGMEHLKETIGLSITNNYLYQFLFINETIEVIRYDYGKLSENHDKKIDGKMLDKGLEDLIPLDIVNKLMTVIQWTGSDEESKNHDNANKQQPIISIAMSINTNGKIRIYCLKSYDRLEYYVVDYNQEIYMDKIERFYGKNNINHITGTISYENNGIIIFFYNKQQSYRMKMLKLHEKHYGKTEFEWKKFLAVDSGSNFIYQLNEKPNDEQKQELKKSFNKIFGQHTFTYGFVDKGQIYLFSNQNDKVITFSIEIFENNEKKYPFKLQSYEDIIDCNKKIEPIIIDNKQKEHNETDVTNEPNGFKFSTTILAIIVASIIIFLLLIVSLVYCLRKKSGKKNPVKQLPLTSLPKQQINLDGTSDSLISPTKTTTATTVTST